jgi:hypothetical protein
VGDWALTSFAAAVLTLRWPVIDGLAMVSPRVVEAAGLEGENGPSAGISQSLELGRTTIPSEDVGLETGAIGLSGAKKLDFRLNFAGEGDICARLSIVRSDKDGREGLRSLGVFGSSVDEMAA